MKWTQSREIAGTRPPVLLRGTRMQRRCGLWTILTDPRRTEGGRGRVPSFFRLCPSLMTTRAQLPPLPLTLGGTSGRARAGGRTDGRLDGWDGADSISHAYQNQASLRLMRADEPAALRQREGGRRVQHAAEAHNAKRARTGPAQQAMRVQYLLAMSPTWVCPSTNDRR